MRRPAPWAARVVGVVGGINKHRQRARNESSRRNVSAPSGCRRRALHASARAVGALVGCRRRKQHAPPEGTWGARAAQRKRASRVSMYIG